jgi:hypothetical protein
MPMVGGTSVEGAAIGAAAPIVREAERGTPVGGAAGSVVLAAERGTPIVGAAVEGAGTLVVPAGATVVGATPVERGVADELDDEDE